MAAPANAYISTTFHAQNNDEGIHYIALPQADTATLKSRFYLDTLFPQAGGFIGACYENSFNARHHNQSRKGKFWYFYNGWVQICKDAGLNTLPNVINVNPISKKIGSLQVQMNVQSAYYLNTDSWGIQYIDKPTQQWALANGLTDAVAQGSSENRTASTQAYGTDTNQYVADDTVTIRAFASNAEGTWYTDPIAFKVETAPYTLGYNPSTASQAKTMAQTITVELRSYPFFNMYSRFKRVGVGDTVQDGYYYDPQTNQWYLIQMDTNDTSYSIVNAKGTAEVGSYPSGDPANGNTAQYFTFSYSSYSTSVENSCGFATGGNNNVLYQPLSGANSNYYYSNTALTVYASDGYYTVINGNGSKRWHYISGGLRVSQGDCGSGGQPGVG